MQGHPGLVTAAAIPILLLGAVARILHLGDQALWIDEGATYAVIRQPNAASILTFLAERDAHPPLYFLLLKAWTRIAGDSVVALRLFSALASLLSVAAVVPLAREMLRIRPDLRGPAIPLLAALMLALSDPEFVLAQDMRMHALRTLLAIAIVLFYLRWLRIGRVRDAVGVWLAGTAILHTHIQGVYVLMAVGLHALLFLRGRLRLTALASVTACGLAFLPWFIGFGQYQLDYDHGVASALPSTWETLLVLGGKYLSQMWPLTVGLMLVGTAALIARPGQPRLWDRAALLWAWIGITVGVSYIVNWWVPVLAPHRILLLSPALAILIALGIAQFARPARAFLVAVLVVYGVTTVDDYYPKEPWDEVGADVARYFESGELVLLEVYRGDYPLMYYLDRLLPPGTQVESLRVWREFQADGYPQGVIDAIAAHETVWLTHWSPDPSAFTFLNDAGFIRTAAQMTDHWGNAIMTYRYDRGVDGAPLAAFTSGMTLRRARLLDDRVDLWWSADAPLALDYSVSVFVLGADGAVVMQHDAFPFENRRPTTGWSPGEIVYDPHPLALDALPPGMFPIGVQVYTYFDGVRFPLVTGEDWAIIGEWRR
jgi:4-amino-4-deoxy-L-arabinose transferase-like glycosyltransferase